MKAPFGKEFGLLVFTSIAILPGFLLEVTNLPKFSFLLFFAAVLVYQVDLEKVKIRFKVRDVVMLSSVAILSLALLWLLSDFDPMLTELFGVPGRMFGVASFSASIIIGLVFYLNYSFRLEQMVISALNFVALAVSLYAGMQFFNWDPIDWENWYSQPSSFFGNPNFVSAFLGLASLSLLFYPAIPNKLYPTLKSLREKKVLTRKKLTYLNFRRMPLLAVYLFTLYLNGSVQGWATLFLSSLVIVCLKYVDSKRKLWILGIGMLSAGSIFLYLTRSYLLNLQEVRTRLLFWNTGISAALERPFVGVGATSLEDNYNTYSSTELADSLDISKGITSDSSHNIFIDLAFSGGMFLSVGFLLLILLPFTFYIRDISLKNHYFDFWIGLQIGSFFLLLINPPHLTMFLWATLIGFVCLGVLSSSHDFVSPVSDRRQRKGTRASAKSRAAQAVSSIVLLAIGFLPMYSDLRFRESIFTRDLYAIESTAKKFPTNPERLLFAVNLMCSNQSVSQGKELLDFGRERFPNNQRIVDRVAIFDSTTKTVKERRAELLRLNPGLGSDVRKYSLFGDTFKDRC